MLLAWVRLREIHGATRQLPNFRFASSDGQFIAGQALGQLSEGIPVLAMLVQPRLIHTIVPCHLPNATGQLRVSASAPTFDLWYIYVSKPIHALSC